MRATIEKVKRERNSANGNPRWRVFTSQGVYLTGTDSMIGHEISESWQGYESLFTFDRNGCIIDAERL